MKLLNKSLIRKNWLVPALTGAFSVLLASTAIAQDDGSERKTKETVAMSQQVYESLVEVQELVEADNFQLALAKSQQIQGGKKKMSPYETAQI